MQARLFDWRAPVPERVIKHPLVDELTEALCRYEVRLVYGGRGMGKSVLMHQVVGAMKARQVTCVHIQEGADAPSLRQALLDALPGARGATTLFDALASTIASMGSLVIVIDEIDSWLRDARLEASRDLLNALSPLQRGSFAGRLGILVAGGVAPLQLFTNPLGSPFSSRVDRTHYLRSFSREEIEGWAEPLCTRESAFNGEWLSALRVASGGVPLLVAAALQAAWEAAAEGRAQVLHDPVRWIDQFIREQKGFRDAVRAAVSPNDTTALRLLQLISESEGVMESEQLKRAEFDPYKAERIIHVLAASGLVADDYDLEEEPWRVRVTPSLLRLGPPPARVGSLAERAVDDLTSVARQLARYAVDLWQGRGGARRLVTEATLSAMVAVAVLNRGWRAEREPQRGPGRVDVIMTRQGVAGEVVIEVKLWGRNDYQGVEEQVRGYTREDAEAMVCLMIAEHPVLPDVYRGQVRGADGLGEPEALGEVTRWRGERARADGRMIPSVHLLLCLPRR